MTLEQMKQALLAALAWLKGQKEPPPIVITPPSHEDTMTIEGIRAAHPSGWCEGALEERRSMYLLACSIAKEVGLGMNRTAEYLATIKGESGWNQYCIGRPNVNGTQDWGIAQFNDHTYLKEYQMSPVEALLNPEKCLRIMAENFKTIRRNNWAAYQPQDSVFQARMKNPFP